MQLLLKILGWAALVALALVLLVAGSVVVDAALDRNRLEGLTNTRISPEVQAFVAKPEGSGPFPAVVMIHEFWGLKAEIVEKAKLLAQEGYVVVAPDTYRGARTDWIPRAIYLSATTPVERVNQDLDAVYDWLMEQPEVDKTRVGIMGFCYGGTASLNYSLHNPRIAATGIFYGQLVTDPETLKRLPGPVLGIFGSADNLIPVGEVRAFEQALQQAGIPHEIDVYEGQGHAFVTGVEGIRAGGAQGEAWRQFLEFFRKNLKEGPGKRVIFTQTRPQQHARHSQGTWLEVAKAHSHH